VAIASPGALLPAVAWAFTRCAFLVLMVSKPGEGADFVSKLRRTERAPGEGARRAASIVFLFLIPYLPNHSLTAKRRTSCLHTHTQDAAFLTLFNLQGQSAFEVSLTGQRTTLQLPVPPGIYWARLQIKGQQPEHHKIIVSR